MGVHRDRLGAAKAHRAFVEGANLALQKWASENLSRQIPIAAISPSAIAGVRLLPMPVPPMLEEALGYGGALRFVSFGYCPRTRRFGHCDGGDDIPADPATWLRFLHHSFVNSHLPETRYPTLHGIFRRTRGSESFVSPHCLLLDREKRQLYICRRGEAILFLSLVEPDDKEGSRIFIDNLRMSPGDEDYKMSPRKELAAALLGWLDEQAFPV
jgi:hypothetical protein